MSIVHTVKVRVRKWISRRSNRRLIADYVRRGRIPWSKGYRQYRAQYIAAALADPELVARFRRSEPLPPGYGIGLDERCVEHLWVISRLEAGPARCLDAGSALNHVYVLDHPVVSDKKLHIITLAPERQCFWNRGISYLYEDLRCIPIQDDFYDAVISISTLEHVGFDNSRFTYKSSCIENSSDDFKVALRELWRVLKPGGQLLITVPFGVYMNFGTFQQFDLALLREMESLVEASDVEIRVYRYDREGWVLSNVEDCMQSEYFPLCMISKDQRPVVRLPEHPTGAAAAGAVICVRFSKRI